MTKSIKFSLLVAVLVALAGCATSPGAPSAAGKTRFPTSLEDRVAKRWELLIAHKADIAYDLLTPGFRATKTREVYAMDMNNRPVRWTAATFMDKTCDDEEACEVNVGLSYTVPVRGASPNTAGFSVGHEKWVKLSGQWFFLPDNIGSAGLKR